MARGSHSADVATVATAARMTNWQIGTKGKRAITLGTSGKADATR